MSNLPLLRVIPDVNILIRALVGRGLPALLYDHFLRGELRFVISADLMSEVYHVLGYPRVITLGAGITPSIGFGLAFNLMVLSEYHPLVTRLSWPTLRDPKDWYLLDLLWESNADVLLTADKTLLEAGDQLDLPVLTLETFLDWGGFVRLEL